MYELTQQIEKSIRLLQHSRNPLASGVLAVGLKGPSSPVRARIVQALAVRADSIACATLAESFDRLDPAERKLLTPKSRQIGRSVPELLQGRSSIAKRAAVAAVCGLELLESIPEILRIAMDRNDSQTSFAQDQLLKWSLLNGARDVATRESNVIRLALLEQLYQLLQQETGKLPPVFLDSFLACIRWDDVIAAKLFRSSSSPAHQRVIQHLRQTTRPEALHFLAMGLTQKLIPHSIAAILRERNDFDFANCLGEFAHRQMNATMRSNMLEYGTMAVFNLVSPTDSSHTLEARRGICLMKAAANIPSHYLLEAALEFLKQQHPLAEQTAIDLLDSLPYLKLESQESTELRVQISSRSKPVQAQNENTVRCYQELLSIFPDQSQSMKQAIQRVFTPFRLEGLQQGMGRWSDEKTASIARIVKIVDSTWQTALLEDLRSPSPKRRERSLRTMLHLGVDSEEHWQELVKALYDDYPACRCRAIDVLVNCNRQREAIELLQELQHDPDSDVRSQAESALSNFAFQRDL